MALVRYRTIYFLLALLTYDTSNLELVDSEISHHDNPYTKNNEVLSESCARVHPSTRDLVRRFISILLYFDKDNSNTEFLRKYRATVYGMSEADDPLDKEVAFYAAALTPLIFLQNYKNTWCLLERFHRALRLYQNSHPTEKRPALKLLQNFRAVNQKVHNIISEFPVPSIKSRSTDSDVEIEDIISDKKDIRYIKEIIKNFG